MNTNTHKLIANKILDNLEYMKIDIIKRDSFIWGNIKPDTVSKYKLIKHYFMESFEMTIRKIDYLSSFSIEDLGNDISLGKFSSELGVICHFICDYFTMPHYDRWEFKHSMKKHIKYEQELSKFAKSYNFNNLKYNKISIGNLAQFILDMQLKYSAIGSYEEDLQYAYHVCSIVVYVILEQVLENTYLGTREIYIHT